MLASMPSRACVQIYRFGTHAATEEMALDGESLLMSNKKGWGSIYLPKRPQDGPKMAPRGPKVAPRVRMCTRICRTPTGGRETKYLRFLFDVNRDSPSEAISAALLPNMVQDGSRWPRECAVFI